MKIQTTNQITGRRRWVALAAVMVTMFFSSLDQTIVATAMPTVIGDLKGLDIYAWVFTAYMMTSAITVPIYGKLSDIYGRKPFYVFGLALFIIGSALAGLSQSMMWLIVSRGIQGFGGGAMMSMPRATIGDIFNPKERGKWMGLIMSVFGLASIIGPYMGGWLTDNLNWRWVFYINLPVAIIALIAVFYALPTVRTGTKHHVDWLGGIVMAFGLVPILLGFTWAGSKFDWGSSQIIGLFAVGVVFLLLFALVEKRALEPVLSPTIFSNKIFSITAVIGLLIGMTMFGSLMFLPLFVQGVVGMSATNSGAVMTPMMLSFIVGAVISGGIISRTGRYKFQAVIAALLMILGTFMLTRMGVNTTWPTIVRNMLIIGLGLGSMMPLINVVVQNAFPYRMMGVVNSTQQFVNSLGGIIIAPIMGTILSKTFNNEMAEKMPAQFLAAVDKMPESIKSVLSNPQGLIDAQAQALLKAKFAALGGAGAALYDQFMNAVKVSIADGITKLFTLGMVFACLTLFTVLFLKEIPLKRDEFFKEDQGETQPKTEG